MSGFSGKAAIAGLGATEFSKNSGRSEMQLAVEAVTLALADAGIEPGDVDGISTYTMDNNLETEVFRNIGGKDLKFFGRVEYGGGGACAPLQQASMAIHCGVADVVVCYRAMNERSEYRFGQPLTFQSSKILDVLMGLSVSQGLQTAAANLAIGVRRYMHETGATESDLAQIALTDRHHAATNPAAFFYEKPITLEEHQASRMVADPFRLFDCCQESDGAVAVVLVSLERSRTLRQEPVVVSAAAQGAPRGTVLISNFYEGDITLHTESELVAKQLYAQSRLTANDIDVAIFYDHFGPTVLPMIEAYGFCQRGEAKDFVKDGNIRIGGTLPINTHGGQLGEAYIHGMNGVAEAVRQIRGAAVNQVSDVNHVLVTAGSGVPTSGAILSKC